MNPGVVRVGEFDGPRRLTRRQLFHFDRRITSASSDHWIRVHRAAMACRFEISLSEEDQQYIGSAREALDEVDRLEAALTVFRETSELSGVNRRAAVEPVVVSEELFNLLCRCRELHAETRGAFDITSTPLSRCWGFLKREGRLPRLHEIDKALASVGMDGVELDVSRRTVSFCRPGMELNLGSIGKGYSLERAAEVLRAHRVNHALLSAGGSSVVAMGGRDGGWMIDVRSRHAKRGRLARLRLRNGALGTSGNAEQFFEIDGTRYGHVFDPRTGWPASGILSASVVAADGAVADALATAFLVGGLEDARRYCALHPNTLALITRDDGSERPYVLGSFIGATVEGVQQE